MNLTTFLETHKPGFYSEAIKYRPNGWDGNHYLITLSFNGGQHTFFFTQGKGIKTRPDVSIVLECLQSDCRTGDNTYQQFANEYGYNHTLSEGYQTWMACQETRNSLIDLFGQRVYNEFMELEFD